MVFIGLEIMNKTVIGQLVKCEGINYLLFTLGHVEYIFDDLIDANWVEQGCEENFYIWEQNEIE
jgi:hypothetical protein